MTESVESFWRAASAGEFFSGILVFTGVLCVAPQSLRSLSLLAESVASKRQVSYVSHKAFSHIFVIPLSNLRASSF